MAPTTMVENTQTEKKKGAGVARRKKSPSRSRKKQVEEDEANLSAEELEMRAKLRKAMGRKGIWEVTLNDGIVLGHYQGTPQRIGAYINSQQEDPVTALYFQLTKIVAVPEEIQRERCCERRFQRKDNFCPVCGQSRHVQPTIPKGIQVEIYTE